MNTLSNKSITYQVKPVKCASVLLPRLFVYIIECNQSGYYVGVTRNLPRRLEQHRTLKGSSRFVKEHGGILRLVHSELALTKAKARKRESELTKALILEHGAGMVAGAGLISLSDRERYERRVKRA